MRICSYQFVLAFILLLVNPCNGQGVDSGGGSLGEGAVAGGGGGDFWTKVSLENRFRKNEEYGFLIATQKLFGQKETFLYVCIVKHQYKGDENDRFRYQVKVENGNADAMHCINVKGRRFFVHYSSKVSENRTRNTHEDIKINGKKVDLEKGRVFVIDLEAKAIKVKQIKFNMPIELRALEPRAKVPRKIWAEKLRLAVEKNEIEAVCFEVVSQKNCEFK